jgi:RsiW-degrading membrane proteinase PrsW (M82 family)
MHNAGMRWVIWYLKPRLRPWLRRWQVYLPAAVIVVLGVIIGVVLDLLLGTVTPILWRAERTAETGDLATAERLYWQAIQEGQGDGKVVLDFLEIHVMLAAMGKLDPETLSQLARGTVLPEPSVSEAEIDDYLQRPDLPDGVAWVAGYWRALLQGETTAEADAEIEAEAEQEPPLPWANHVLAKVAVQQQRYLTAAACYEREGLRGGGPVEDLRSALHLYMMTGETEQVRRCLDDSRFSPVVSPYLRAEMAFAERDWGKWLTWLWPAIYLRGNLSSWLLATLSAGLWFWFCWSLGGTGLSLRLQLAAVVLGALSIYPTHILISLGELYGLQQTGNLVADAIYFTAGVGLREEAAKLLCFLPLLPVVRRLKGDGNALVLGALVGLGFAAIENVSYFAGGDLATALARFLTANFLHMSLTAIIAEVCARVAAGKSTGNEVVQTFVMIVVLHGAYDLFLSSPQLRELSFLAMTTFVIIARQFLRAAPVARARGGMPLLRVVVMALVILGAASFIYGSAVAGPKVAAVSLVQGLLGVIIITAVFHHELA